MKISINPNKLIFKAVIILTGFNLLITDSHARETITTKNLNTLPGFAKIVKRASPAVVSIQAVKIFDKNTIPDSLEDSTTQLPPIENNNETSPMPEKYRNDSNGSGFIISPDGLIITNHHVIEDALRIVVKQNNKNYIAKLIGDDSTNDIALLKIESQTDFPFLKLADSEQAQIGDWLIVIGSPLLLSNSVSVGIISAKDRSINVSTDSSFERFIQTDAAINFGNSGGPLINLQGEVIGIATATNFGSENIGFAVPSNIVTKVLPQLKENGRVYRGFLGIQLDSVDADIAEAFGLKKVEGALIHNIIENSPADTAELKHGDIILSADNNKITNHLDLINYISSLKPGTKTRLEIFRSTQLRYYDVFVGEREPNKDLSVESNNSNGIENFWPGLEYETINNHEQQYVQITEVNPISYFYDKGIRSLDIIKEVNGQTLHSSDEFKTILESVKSGDLLKLYLTSPSSRGKYIVIRVP